MKIAIFDVVNQDIGLKILFPEADYYIHNLEVNKDNSFKKFNFQPKTDIENINDKNYNVLFIIIALYDTKYNTRFFKQNIYDILQKIKHILDSNYFEKVFLFDNYDYDYDPTEIFYHETIDYYFKRNYNIEKKYNQKVVSFPFLMFGEISIIEKILNSNDTDVNALDRIFFSGTLFKHEDENLNYYRDRQSIYSKINNFIHNPGYINYNDYLKEINKSKFSLDLNGVGDPNKRTFEILSQGSLKISEKNNLLWPFEENFSPETIFTDEFDFQNKINLLRSDHNLYLKCLDNQNKIFKKYFNVNWLRNYLENFLNKKEDITLFITSCGRPELLSQTLNSFIKFNTYPIKEVILCEDSGNLGIVDFVKDILPYSLKIYYNEERIGQMKTIEKYTKFIKTPWVFHLEDDYEFFDYSFIELSLKILKSNPKISQVLLQDEQHHFPTIDINHPLCYKIMTSNENDKNGNNGDGPLTLFSWRPSLKRLEISLLRIPYQPWDDEYTIQLEVNKRNYFSVITKNVKDGIKGFCRHIGKNHHVPSQIKDTNKKILGRDDFPEYRYIRIKDI